MTSFLLTGGAGFLGSTVALRLRSEWPDARITVLDNLRRRGSEGNIPRLRAAGVDFVHGDIRNPEDLAALPPADVLVECSAEPSVLAQYGASGPEYVVNTNLVGTFHCLEYAREHGAAVVFFSTSRVYPIETLNAADFVETDTRFEWTDDQDVAGLSSRGVSEELPLEGARSLYGATKLASELLLEEYRYACDVPYVVNRCGVIGGPWQMGKVDQGLVALWILRHLYGEGLDYIGFGGKGKQVRDVIHVDDVADLAVHQIERLADFDGGVFNVGGGPERSVSLRELTELCRSATGREIPMGSEPETRPADLRIYVSDCSKLYRATSWRPQRSLERTVRDTSEWARDHRAEVSHLLEGS